jgi:hypothetical protein
MHRRELLGRHARIIDRGRLGFFLRRLRRSIAQNAHGMGLSQAKSGGAFDSSVGRYVLNPARGELHGQESNVMTSVTNGRNSAEPPRPTCNPKAPKCQGSRACLMPHKESDEAEASPISPS